MKNSLDWFRKHRKINIEEVFNLRYFKDNLVPSKTIETNELKKERYSILKPLQEMEIDKPILIISHGNFLRFITKLNTKIGNCANKGDLSIN